MNVSVKLPIDAPKEAIWETVTDIENATETVSAIDKIEILEKPGSGLVGLKWRETRQMFGKEATEVMWITQAQAPEFYRTRAESHGSVYISEVAVGEEGGTNVLSMSISTHPQSLVAKILSPPLGLIMRGAMAKALMQDLQDIKAAVEGQRQPA